MLMTRNVVRLPFVDDKGVRFLTRIRWLSTATVRLQNCGGYIQLRGHNFSSSISVRNLGRKAKGRAGYNRSRDRVDHDTGHITYATTLPEQQKSEERTISLLYYPASNSLTLFLSLSRSYLQTISSHLYIRTVKKLAKKPRPPLILCKKTNGIKCWLHQFIFNFALHTLLSFATILITFISAYFYFFVTFSSIHGGSLVQGLEIVTNVRVRVCVLHLSNRQTLPIYIYVYIDILCI